MSELLGAAPGGSTWWQGPSELQPPPPNFCVRSHVSWKPPQDAPSSADPVCSRLPATAGGSCSRAHCAGNTMSLSLTATSSLRGRTAPVAETRHSQSSIRALEMEGQDVGLRRAGSVWSWFLGPVSEPGREAGCSCPTVTHPAFLFPLPRLPPPPSLQCSPCLHLRPPAPLPALRAHAPSPSRHSWSSETIIVSHTRTCHVVCHSAWDMDLTLLLSVLGSLRPEGLACVEKTHALFGDPPFCSLLCLPPLSCPASPSSFVHGCPQDAPL